VLGQQDKKDLSFLTYDKQIEYTKKLQQTVEKIEFDKEYPEINKIFCNLLGNWMNFNPYFRHSASHYLKLPIFDEFREPEMEKIAPFQIKIPMDDQNFDYNKLESQVFSEDDYKQMVADEIKSFIN